MADKPANRSHSLATVQRGLTAVAYANGNTRQAARELAQAGITLDHKTLWRWAKQNHREEYERIRREVLPIVGAEVADEHMELARENIDIEREIAASLRQDLKDLSARDKATALRNVAVSAAVHTDKARDLAGDFETPSRQKDITQILRSLKDRLGGLEALPEIVDAEVAEE